MRKIDTIILHCTATPRGRDYSVDTIRGWHKARGWNDIGYHYIIHLDGTISEGRPVEQAGAHAKNYNANSIGIAYIGGLDESAKESVDTRTPEQDKAFKTLIAKLIEEHKDIRVLIGHRDTSPDLNGDGTVERGEWIKDCPCFEVEESYGIWFRNLLIMKHKNKIVDEIYDAYTRLADKRKRSAGY